MGTTYDGWGGGSKAAQLVEFTRKHKHCSSAVQCTKVLLLRCCQVSTCHSNKGEKQHPNLRNNKPQNQGNYQERHRRQKGRAGTHACAPSTAFQEMLC